MSKRTILKDLMVDLQSEDRTMKFLEQKKTTSQNFTDKFELEYLRHLQSSSERRKQLQLQLQSMPPSVIRIW